MAGGLTKKAIDAAAASDERYVLWDSEVRGFGVLVLPSGVKSFIVKYRNAAGRQRRLTIGRFGVFTVDQARDEARAALVAVARGGDPLDERQRVRSAPDVASLLDRYLEEHVDAHNAKSTAADVRRIVEGHLKPRIGHLQVHAVTKQDLAAVHHALRATRRRANTVLAVASKAFSLAETWGLRPANSNPVRGIKRYDEEERERFLTPDELGRLGEAIRQAEDIGLPWKVTKPGSKHLPAAEHRRSPLNGMALAAILLLLFTGARLMEILALQWPHVDLAAETVALPDRKGRGRRPHPVNSAAMELLGRLHARKRGKWVLPGDDKGTRHVTKSVVEGAWQRLRAFAGLADVRLHDLRHTVGTYAGQDGSNAFLISHVLRQRTIAVTGRYVNPHADPIRSLSETVGERIVSGLKGKD